MKITEARDYMIGCGLLRGLSRGDAEDVAHDVIVRALQLGRKDEAKRYWGRAMENGAAELWRKDVNRRKRNERYSQSPSYDVDYAKWADLGTALRNPLVRKVLGYYFRPQTESVRVLLHRARRKMCAGSTDL